MRFCYVPTKDRKKVCNRVAANLFIAQGVQPSSQIPSGWQQFLRSEENKQDLFQFPAQCIVSLHEEKQVITTKGKDILCSPARNNTTNLAPCTHEEADTRIILHATDAVRDGYRTIVLRTVDTDVLVLAIAFAGILQEQQVQQVEVWVAMGIGSHFRYIAAHEISNNLPSGMSKALPVFHAFTGCDTVYCFAGRGKKTAFTVWKKFPAVTDTFLQLAATPTSPIREACMERLERFVVLMDDRTSYKASDETRKQCLHRKVEHMMLSHQPGRPCYSTQTELLIKLVTVGAKHLHQAQIYLHQGIGDGFSKRKNGSLSGRRFQM